MHVPGVGDVLAVVGDQSGAVEQLRDRFDPTRIARQKHCFADVTRLRADMILRLPHADVSLALLAPAVAAGCKGLAHEQPD